MSFHGWSLSGWVGGGRGWGCYPSFFFYWSIYLLYLFLSRSLCLYVSFVSRDLWCLYISSALYARLLFSRLVLCRNIFKSFFLIFFLNVADYFFVSKYGVYIISEINGMAVFRPLKTKLQQTIQGITFSRLIKIAIQGFEWKLFKYNSTPRSITSRNISARSHEVYSNHNPRLMSRWTVSPDTQLPKYTAHPPATTVGVTLLREGCVCLSF